MRNPNFLVLDEPANDLDIVTLNILEDYLQSFKGCVIVVSHDRYFMDKVVDHLLVFKGDAELKDFPGNYTDYREWTEIENETEAQNSKTEQKSKEQRSKNKNPESNVEGATAKPEKRKLSYKEQKELEALDAEIPALEQEKADIEARLASGQLTADEIMADSQRHAQLIELIDEKSMRWLELSDI